MLLHSGNPHTAKWFYQNMFDLIEGEILRLDLTINKYYKTFMFKLLLVYTLVLLVNKYIVTDELARLGPRMESFVG